MLKNYFNIAFRNLLHNKTYMLVNVAGLSVALASCLLLFIYIQDELGFDTHHEKEDQIYRVCRDYRMANAEGFSGTTTPPLAEALEEDFPGIENTVRISSWHFENVIRYKERHFVEDRIIAADASIFEVFTIPYLSGNPETALKDPFSIVFTERMVKKYFGDENPIGKRVQFMGREYQVTGIIEDCPRQSHLQYDFIFSLSSLDNIDHTNWGQHAITTYILLHPEANPQLIESQFPAFVRRHLFGNNVEALQEFSSGGYHYAFSLQPLSDIYLNSSVQESYGLRGSRTSLMVLSALALLILIVASINYVNLSTVMSFRRNKEMALRRILGGNRTEMMKRLFVESLLITVFSFMLSLILVELVFPLFRQITGKPADLSILISPVPIFFIVGLLLSVALSSGIFVGLTFSSSRLVDILQKKPGILRGRATKQGLIAIQFAICIVIIIATMTVYRQVEFVGTRDLGFDAQNTLVLKHTNLWGNDRVQLKRELLEHPDITAVTNINEAFGQVFNNMGHKLETGENGFLYTMNADYDFVDTFGLSMQSGRYFSRDRSTDEQAVVINEAAVRMLGLDNPVGQRFLREQPLTIVGVIEDFHFNSLHHQIEPLIIYLNNELWGRHLYIKYRSDNIQALRKTIELTWKKYAPDQPFISSFLTDELQGLYQNARKTQLLLGIFASIAVVVSCLGLLGIISYLTILKTKEIAVRKVLGASVARIVRLLTWNAIRLILIANIIAWPIAWFAMNLWLTNFSYRIELGPVIFLSAGGVAVLIALVTVSWQSIRAAFANPVESLQSE